MTAKLRTRLGLSFSSDDLAKAYRLTFRNPTSARFVLPDLLEYTGVFNPAPEPGDVWKQGRAAGRRDVGLHIISILDLTDEEVAAVLTGREILRPEDFKQE